MIRPWIRLRCIGRENVPREGALIVCSNHISYFDPVSVGLGIARNIRFMAKSELFTDGGRLFSLFLRSCGVFAVERNQADKNAVTTAEKLLSKGKVIGIFPQGGIVRNRQEFSPKAGAALLSVRTQTPILPVSVYAEGKIRPFCKITVRYGEVMIPPADRSLKAARKWNRELETRILAQLEEKHQ